MIKFNRISRINTINCQISRPFYKPRVDPPPPLRLKQYKIYNLHKLLFKLALRPLSSNPIFLIGLATKDLQPHKIYLFKDKKI